MPLFDGKVAVVTGGGSGIGQAACHLYSREGAKVVVSDIDEKAGTQTVEVLREWRLSGKIIGGMKKAPALPGQAQSDILAGGCSSTWR